MAGGIDDRAYHIIFAEVGGGPPEEVAAASSVLINLINKYGYEKALKRFSSYTTKSNQYKKASEGDLNAYEKAVYNRNKNIFDNIMSDPQLLQPWTHFENVNAFGDPSWASSMERYRDIGRQRFYVEPSNPRVKAVREQKLEAEHALSQ